jgi:hypothetical protein
MGVSKGGFMTHLEELKARDPKLYQAYCTVGAGNTRSQTLKAMVRALTLAPRLNTAEDMKRHLAARYILRRRNR